MSEDQKELDKLIDEAIDSKDIAERVLNHGYVKFIEGWGGGTVEDPEAGIIEAARQSTQGSFRGWDRDERLLRYLFNSDPPHATPFEFAGMTIEVQAPIFVFREWHRHRTQSYNEMSARYEQLPPLWYIPKVANLLERSQKAFETANKQAGVDKSAVLLTEENAEKFRLGLEADCKRFAKKYDTSLSNGVPRELARCGMPVCYFSRMRACANLRNWLAFLTLRMDPGAQWEIRQFANAVGRIVAEQFPRTWNLFERKRNLSGPVSVKPGPDQWFDFPQGKGVWVASEVSTMGYANVYQVDHFSEDDSLRFWDSEKDEWLPVEMMDPVRYFQLKVDVSNV